MSERKVLTKYYPPDFDPSKIERVRRPAGQPNKLETVRLMAPFSMKCITCGEYIYKGRKFNARKELTGERYHSTALIRFYIRCTRCSAQITFRTDPQNEDFECERGARRNFEPWRDASRPRETEEEVLDRLHREEEEEARDAMGELEAKMLDSKQEMAIADALDEIRTRNAVHQRVERGEVAVEQVVERLNQGDEERIKQEKEDEAAAKRAFDWKKEGFDDRDDDGGIENEEDVKAVAQFPDEQKTKRTEGLMLPPPTPALMKALEIPSFSRAKKRKRDFSAALGIKKKVALA